MTISARNFKGKSRGNEGTPGDKERWNSREFASTRARARYSLMQIAEDR